MDPKFAFLIFKKRAEDIDFSLLDDLVNVGKAGLRVDSCGIVVDGYIVWLHECLWSDYQFGGIF